MWFKLKILSSFIVIVLYVEASKLNTVVDHCLQQYSINADVLLHFFRYGELPDENDKNAQCIFLCLAKKLIRAEDYGSVEIPEVDELFASKFVTTWEPSSLMKTVEKCSNRNEIDPCEKVYQFSKCHMKTYLSVRT